MGRNRDSRKAKNRFRVVQQPYDAKDFEDKPELVPVNSSGVPLGRKVTIAEPVCRFDDEELPMDFTDRRNMLMVSDKLPEEMVGDDDVGLFDYDDEEDWEEEEEDEEVEEGDDDDDDRSRARRREKAAREEFDENFIKQLMYGDAPGDEQPVEIADTEYPVPNRPKGALEKQFDAAMREFAIDDGLDEHDPRAHGQLDAKDYAPALEAFVQEHAGNSMMSDLPLKHRGLLNQLRNLSRTNRVFDSDAKGNFITVLGDKAERRVEDYFNDADGLREATLAAVRAEKARLQRLEAAQVDDGTEENLRALRDLAPRNHGEVYEGDEKDGRKLVTMTLRKTAAEGAVIADCVTAITASTRYNHPNVILPASKKQIKLSIGAAHKVHQQRYEEKQEQLRAAAAAAKPAEEENILTAQAAKAPPAPKAPGGDDGVILTAKKMRQKEREAEAKVAAMAPEPEEESDSDSSLGVPPDEVPYDLSLRHKDETAEEKKQRRKLVKELQAMRRQEKKAVKTVYRDVHLDQAARAPISKQQKAQIPLSVVRAEPRK